MKKLLLLLLSLLLLLLLLLKSGKEAEADLVLIQPFLLNHVNQVVLTQTSIFHHIFIRKGRKEVCIKVRSTSASRTLRGWGTKPIAVKWSIGKSAGGTNHNEANAFENQTISQFKITFSTKIPPVYNYITLCKFRDLFL